VRLTLGRAPEGVMGEAARNDGILDILQLFPIFFVN
jgi:hypothetical protein